MIFYMRNAFFDLNPKSIKYVSFLLFAVSIASKVFMTFCVPIKLLLSIEPQ